MLTPQPITGRMQPPSRGQTYASIHLAARSEGRAYELTGPSRGTFILIPVIPRREETVMPGFIKTEMEDRLAIVTVNRPDALNALNSTVLRELSMAIEHLSMAADVGAIILTGGGGQGFVAGPGHQ